MTPTLPEYRWVLHEQRIAMRPEDAGQTQAMSPEGLTQARGGNLLLAACCPSAGKTFIMRSGDQGRTWQQHGVFAHRQDQSGQSGSVEGMVALASGRLVLVHYVLDQKTVLTKPGNPYYVPGANHFRFSPLRSSQWGAYSDDNGRTWHYTPMNLSPFLSADFEASSQIFESQDGSLVASFRGHLNQEELDSGLTSVGIVRSHDEGLT